MLSLMPNKKANTVPSLKPFSNPIPSIFALIRRGLIIVWLTTGRAGLVKPSGSDGAAPILDDRIRATGRRAGTSESAGFGAGDGVEWSHVLRCHCRAPSLKLDLKRRGPQQGLHGAAAPMQLPCKL